MGSSQEIRIVAFGYDRHADIIPAYEYCLRRYWPGCSYPIVYVMNEPRRELKVEGPVHYISGGFGRRVREFVRQHCQDDDPLLIMLADCLVSGIDTRLMSRAEELINRPEIGHVRLYPKPSPQLPYDDDFGEIKPGSRYSLSLQPGIWKAKIIHDLCRNNDTPFRVEIGGSKRTHNVGKTFLCSKQMAMTYINYYNQGRPFGCKWLRFHASSDVWTDAARRWADTHE
jgi:hypothetical protein